MSSPKLRFAVIGLGKMGLVHAGILNVLPDVQLVAICEKSSFIRRFAKKVFSNIEIVDDTEKLADFDLDAIYVTTPIPSHFSVSKTVLVKKIASNLFVEKTLGQSYDESVQLCELAQRLAGVHMVGYLRRFYVTFKKAKDLLDKEKIGNVESFSAYAYSSDFLESSKDSKASASRGGVLRDLGCHALDLALWMFKELKVNCAWARSKSSLPSDSISFKVGKGELEGEFDVSWCMPSYRLPEVGFTVHGSRGDLFVNDDEVKLKVKDKSFLWYRHDLNDNVPFLLGLPEYYHEDHHFVKSIIDSTKAEPDFYEASLVDKIIAQVAINDA